MKALLPAQWATPRRRRRAPAKVLGLPSFALMRESALCMQRDFV